jgi:anion-transporting  ArsA/GET3 family ATPase
MAFLLTFLGKGGVGKTTLAIAAAQRFAAQGQRVLLLSQDSGPGLGMALGQTLGEGIQTIGPKFDLLQCQTAPLLAQAWDELKGLESQYLRTPFFKNVYGQELGVLPGMESMLVLNQVRRYDGQYDAIVLDGGGNQETLRMLGMPEIGSWYARRFRQVFADSDLGRTIGPFLPPIAAAVLNVSWTADNFGPTNEANALLDQGRAKIADPSRTAAYLVTTADPAAIATAQYLWGSAQQVGLTVGGLLLNPMASPAANQAIGIDGFAPLACTSVPAKSGTDWQGLMAALPDFGQAMAAPKPIVIDVVNRQVSLFLPSFNKQQVKLTQSGPEITIEAGDQRRNIFLPPELTGKPVSGAKFQDGYLIIAFQ